MAVVGALALAACAGASKQSKDAPKEQSELICTWERSIGSNIPEKVCREPEDEAAPAQGSAPSNSSGQTTR
ncbi:MAG: hypothetical protein ACJ79H_10600 [Myxococcales bacterium]